MPLVSAAIMPHSPVLIPTIGTAEIKDQIKNTISAINKIKTSIESLNPDTIIILSPRINKLRNAFAINISEFFEVNFIEFGDLKTKLNINGDIGLALSFKQDEKDMTISLITKQKLDYETSIPLYFLAQNIKPKIIPIESSILSLKDHFDFGKIIKEEICLSNKKIAVIASSLLSHKSSTKSPLGYSEKAKDFDKNIIDFLQLKNRTGFLSMKNSLLREVGEYGIKPISILLGILDEINYTAELECYESPFGIGFLTMNFKM